MKSVLRSLLVIAAIVALLPFFSSCTDQQVAAYEGYDVIKVEGPSISQEIRLGGRLTHSINVVKAPTTYTLSLGEYDPNEAVKDKFTPYVGIDWKVVDASGILPSFVLVTFNPVHQSETQSTTTMTVTFNGSEDQAVNGIYPVKIVANKSTLDRPREIELYIIISIAAPDITPTFQFENLVIAPGESKTNLMTVNGIKANQSFSMNAIYNSTQATKPTISSSNPTLSASNKSTTFTVSVPAEALPNVDDEGVGIYPTYINTGRQVDFNGNRNGFGVEIAGYVVSSVEPFSTVTFGDTVVLNVNYTVRGKGVFVPKLIPPMSIPSDRVVITQSVTPLPNLPIVKVRYAVFFKDNPKGNVNLTLGGDISYGKAVPKVIFVTVR